VNRVNGNNRSGRHIQAFLVVPVRSVDRQDILMQTVTIFSHISFSKVNYSRAKQLWTEDY
jgi:hypothetical protein